MYVRGTLVMVIVEFRAESGTAHPNAHPQSGSVQHPRFSYFIVLLCEKVLFTQLKSTGSH